MSHKIIKPEGIELIEYLNNGYAICNRCGAVMRQTEDPKTGCGIYICILALKDTLICVLEWLRTDFIRP